MRNRLNSFLQSSRKGRMRDFVPLFKGNCNDTWSNFQRISFEGFFCSLNHGQKSMKVITGKEGDKLNKELWKKKIVFLFSIFFHSKQIAPLRSLQLGIRRRMHRINTRLYGLCDLVTNFLRGNPCKGQPTFDGNWLCSTDLYSREGPEVGEEAVLEQIHFR